MKLFAMRYFLSLIAASIMFLDDWIAIDKLLKRRIKRFGLLRTEEDRESYKVISNVKCITVFTFITLVFCAIAVSGIYFLNELCPKNVIVSTGIHVPVILILSSIMIRLITTIFCKKNPINGKNAVVLCCTFLAGALLFDKPLLGVFTLAMVLGKYIWLDAAFDFGDSINQIKVLVGKVRDKNVTPEKLIFRCCTTFVSLYFLEFLLFKVVGRDLPTKYYIVLFICFLIVSVSSNANKNTGLDVGDSFANLEDVTKEAVNIKEKARNEQKGKNKSDSPFLEIEQVAKTKTVNNSKKNSIYSKKRGKGNWKRKNNRNK